MVSLYLGLLLSSSKKTVFGAQAMSDSICVFSGIVLWWLPFLFYAFLLVNTQR